jgi:hypothetical protein
MGPHPNIMHVLQNDRDRAVHAELAHQHLVVHEAIARSQTAPPAYPISLVLSPSWHWHGAGGHSPRCGLCAC